MEAMKEWRNGRMDRGNEERDHQGIIAASWTAVGPIAAVTSITTVVTHAVPR